MSRLPDYLILGAQKGGTTSLYHYLAAHPGIAPATQKEVHFFDLNFHRGIDWYRSQFPTASGLTGEASPYYLFHPLAPERVRAVLPKVRLIVLLRDPVARAYSHYHHVARQGQEPLTFEEALRAEDERLAGEVEKLRHDGLYRSFAHQKYSYRSRGLYADQLQAWRQWFPSEQILLLRSEDLFEQTSKTWRLVTDFLGLAPAPLPTRLRHNENHYSPLDPFTARQLTEWFAPHNGRLTREFDLDLQQGNAA